VPIKKTIDIRDIDWPVCILNCKNELNRMKPKERMEVLVQDTDVVRNLIALIEQLPGLRIEKYPGKNSAGIIIVKEEQ